MANITLLKRLHRLEAIEHGRDSIQVPEIHRHIVDSAEQVRHPERFKRISTVQLGNGTYLHEYQRTNTA